MSKDILAGLWRQRLRRRSRLAARRGTSGCAGVLPGRDGAAGRAGGNRRWPDLPWRNYLGCVVRYLAGLRGVVVLRRSGCGTHLGRVAADRDPGGRHPRRGRPRAG